MGPCEISTASLPPSCGHGVDVVHGGVGVAELDQAALLHAR